MKKIVVSILLVALCVTAVFASGNTIKASVVPYALQISTSTVDGQDPVHSRYGFGLQAAYQRDLFSGLYAEAGLSWDTFLMPDDRPAFTNLLAFAGVGYEYDFNDKLSTSLHADVGTDTLIYNSKASETFTVKVGLDFNYALNENMDLSVGCEGTFGFSNKSSANYVNYRVIPTIGISFEF